MITIESIYLSSIKAQRKKERKWRILQTNLMKKMIPIFAASFISWFYTMIYAPLGYMYNSFPGMESKVMLIAVLPGIVAMVGGFSAGILMHLIGRKPLIIVSMVLMIVGGLLVRFVGDSSINLVILGSGLTGFGAGAIPATNLSALAAIAPENMRDKVCGWCDSVGLAGMFIVSIVVGFLAADGNWTRSFNVYFFVILVLILAIIWYPNDRVEKEEAAAEPEEESKLPASVICLSVLKFFSALFYMGIGLFVSDYVLNEVQIGTSAAVGSMQSVVSLLGMFASMFVFVFLKHLKGLEGTVMLIITGIGVYLAGVSATIPLIAVAWALQSIGTNGAHSGYTTLCAMAPKGKAAGTASGLLMGAGFLGEALAGYVLPFIAGIVFGEASPSNCMKIGGVGCIVCAIILIPFFRAAYKLAFAEKETAKS